MMEKKINLTLPAFAFVEGSGHEDNLLEGRNVILHIRTASIIEILERDKCRLGENIVKKNFIYTNRYGVGEKMVAALHYCATLDANDDRELIKQEILVPAAKWYCDYCTWEDENIEKSGGIMPNVQDVTHQWMPGDDDCQVLLRTKFPRLIIEVHDEADRKQIADALRKSAEFVLKGNNIKLND